MSWLFWMLLERRMAATAMTCRRSWSTRWCRHTPARERPSIHCGADQVPQPDHLDDRVAPGGSGVGEDAIVLGEHPAGGTCRSGGIQSARLRSLRSSNPSRAGRFRFAFVLGLLDDLSVIAILPMTDSPIRQGPPHPAGHPRSTSLINSANGTPGITQLPGFPHTTHSPGRQSPRMMVPGDQEAGEPSRRVIAALPKLKSNKGIRTADRFPTAFSAEIYTPGLDSTARTFGICGREVPSTLAVAGVNSAKTSCSHAWEPTAAHLHRGYRESTMPWAWHRMNRPTRKKENR